MGNQILVKETFRSRYYSKYTAEYRKSKIYKLKEKPIPDPIGTSHTSVRPVPIIPEFPVMDDVVLVPIIPELHVTDDTVLVPIIPDPIGTSHANVGLVHQPSPALFLESVRAPVLVRDSLPDPIVISHTSVGFVSGNSGIPALVSRHSLVPTPVLEFETTVFRDPINKIQTQKTLRDYRGRILEINAKFEDYYRKIVDPKLQKNALLLEIW